MKNLFNVYTAFLSFLEIFSTKNSALLVSKEVSKRSPEDIHCKVVRITSGRSGIIQAGFLSSVNAGQQLSDLRGQDT